MRLHALALFAGAATALSAAQWRSQSIYQVLTDRFALPDGSTTAPCNLGSYCGGTWRGLINKLDYIQGMGFTAVWISPVIKNIPGPTKYGDPYHGYWPADLYSLNSNFGTPADLKELSTALHARGMYLMVDTVANHMASNGAPSAVRYSSLNPFNNPKYYHPYCPMDHNNMTAVQNCWVGDTVVSLPDLKTEDSAVQAMFNQWIPQLVNNYSIDGLRLDSAMQVNQAFWPPFLSASGVFAIGEVFDGNPNSFCTWQKYLDGMLNYPAYFWILRAFQSTSATMTELANSLKWLNSTCKDTSLLGNFLENHDVPRFASFTTDTGLIKNAFAFTLLNDGMPIVYQGQEQGFSGSTDPYNREALWTSGYNTKSLGYAFITKLNAARSTAVAKDPNYVTSKSSVVYFDDKTLVTSKGSLASPLISVFTNLGASKNSSIKISSTMTGLGADISFTDLLSCTTFTTDASGSLTLNITDGSPRALYRTEMLKGSDPCASTNTVGTTTKISSSTIPATTSAVSSTTLVSSSTTKASSSTPSASSTTSSSSTQASSSTRSSSSSASVSTSATTKTSTASSTTQSTSSSASAAPTTTVTTSTSQPTVIARPVAIACPSSNSTTYTSNGKSFVIECGIDHAGGDMKMVYVKSLAQCIDACADTTDCVDVSLSGTACYMKSKVGRAVYSGVQGAMLLSTSTTSSASSTTTTSTLSSTAVALTSLSTPPTSSRTTSTSSSTSSTSPSTIATSASSSKTTMSIPSSSSKTSACPTATSVSVSFNHNVTTAWLESIKLVGSIEQLGNWNTSKAVALSATRYTDENPTWNTTLQLPAGLFFEYKFLRFDSQGSVSWENGANRNWTVPTGCETTAVLNSTWKAQ